MAKHEPKAPISKETLIVLGVPAMDGETTIDLTKKQQKAVEAAVEGWENNAIESDELHLKLTENGFSPEQADGFVFALDFYSEEEEGEEKEVK